jgi:hypothetical protein
MVLGHFGGCLECFVPAIITGQVFQIFNLLTVATSMIFPRKGSGVFDDPGTRSNADL